LVSSWYKLLSASAPAKVIRHAVSRSIAEDYRVAAMIGVLAVILSSSTLEIKGRTSLHPIAYEIPMSNADHQL